MVIHAWLKKPTRLLSFVEDVFDNATIRERLLDAPARPSSSSGRTANGVSSNGSVPSPTTPATRQIQRKSPTRAGKDDARIKELEAQAEQLKLAKERLCNNAKGFEALSVLIRYYVEKVRTFMHRNKGAWEGRS